MSANPTTAQQAPRYTADPAMDASRYFDALDSEQEAWDIAEEEVRSGIAADIGTARSGIFTDVSDKAGLSLRVSYLMNGDPLWNKAFAVLAAAKGEAADVFWSAVEEDLLGQSEDLIVKTMRGEDA